MKRLFLFLSLITVFSANAQNRYFTRSAKVHFLSKTDMDNIEATNSKGTTVVDTKTGAIEFAVLMKAFEFEKELMMEHFNENYVESDKFPKSIFKGKVVDIANIDFGKDGVYPVKIKGQFTLHGVTKEMAADGSFEIKEGKVSGKSSFVITLADFNILIPSVVKDNISKTIKIDVVAALERKNS